MAEQRVDYVVNYVTKEGKDRKRSFWNQADALAYALKVNARRVERTTIEIIWTSNNDESVADN